MPDVLGITYIEDLSAQDRDKVRSLALLELTVTFDDHNIPLRPRRPAKVKGVQGESAPGSPCQVCQLTPPSLPTAEDRLFGSP